MEIQLQDLLQLVGASRDDDTAFRVGEKYLIRCVTFFYTGRVKQITSSEIVLEDAAWIADTGRFADCLKSGVPSEVEPFSTPVIIPRGSIVDASVWLHNLPREQK